MLSGSNLFPFQSQQPRNFILQIMGLQPIGTAGPVNLMSLLSSCFVSNALDFLSAS